MLEKGAVALNQSSEVFTFKNLRAHSDIDVTIVNDAASMWATYEWRVDVWELSDHNMITVVVTPTTTSTVESIAPVPSWNFSNARCRLFEEEMVRRSTELPEDFSQMPLDQQVSTLCRMEHIVCDNDDEDVEIAKEESSAYADDLLLLIEGKGGHLMSTVETWGVEIGVAVSTSKTVIMMLKGALARAPLVRFAGANLPYVSSCRYLGITISERMSFLMHVASLRERMTGVVGALARVLELTGDSDLEPGRPYMLDSWCLVRYLVPRCARVVTAEKLLISSASFISCESLSAVGQLFEVFADRGHFMSFAKAPPNGANSKFDGRGLAMPPKKKTLVGEGPEEEVSVAEDADESSMRSGSCSSSSSEEALSSMSPKARRRKSGKLRAEDSPSPGEIRPAARRLNLKNRMSRVAFVKEVRVVTKPWEATDGAVNVVLEGTASAMQSLLDVEHQVVLIQS
ncbi:hypothetical protein KR009_009197 [Drosophila setifemur]|nr:hypothetical protein KR009_009197 [Drosophila setifemur]